jgi:hypothetical protein
MKRLNPKRLNERQDKEEYPVKISNRFSALEIFANEVDNNRAWETIRENIKFSAKRSLGKCELK